MKPYHVVEFFGERTPEMTSSEMAQIYLAGPKDAEEIRLLCRKYRDRIGFWWNGPAVREACERKRNRVALVYKDEGKIKGLIILGLWATKGEDKGLCHSLVTISEEKGVATLLQSILPKETVGLVSPNNIGQQRVMVKAGYDLMGTKKTKSGKEMQLWTTPRPSGFLKNVQRRLSEKLRSMEKS